MVPFYNFVNIFAKVTMGILFDRFGIKAEVVFGVLGCALLLIFSFLFGIGLSTQSMFAPSLIGGIYGEKQYSIIYGRISVFTLLAGGISNPVISMVFGVTGGYRIAWILCAAVSVLCGVCLLAPCRNAS